MPEHSLAAQAAAVASLSAPFPAHAPDKADVLQDLEVDNGTSRLAVGVAVPPEDISSRSTHADSAATAQVPGLRTDSTYPIRDDAVPTEVPSARPSAVAHRDANYGNRQEDSGNNERESAE